MARGRKKSVNSFKRANGTGSIKKLSGNRRKPYAALVTVGKEWNEDKLVYKQIQKVIGTYESRADALFALDNYLRNPYDIDVHKITFEDVYNEWSSRYFKELNNDSCIRSVKSAYNYSNALHKRLFNSITIVDMRDCINNAEWNGKAASPSTQGRMKSLFNMMYDYACEAEIVSVNHARNFTIKNMQKKIERAKKNKVPFSEEHEKMLWSNIDYGYIPMILIAIYTGMRPHELCIVERQNVHLEDNYIIGGEKTEAGRDRYIPIHPKIKKLVESYYNISLGKKYLINALDGQQGTTMTYDKYRGRFKNAMKHCGIPEGLYSPHCTRHTFITKAKHFRMDSEAIKLIVGHEFTGDVTVNVYDHSDKHDYLQREILKIE